MKRAPLVVVLASVAALGASARGDDKVPASIDFPFDHRASLRTGDWAAYAVTYDVDGMRVGEPLVYRTAAPEDFGNGPGTEVTRVWGQTRYNRSVIYTTAKARETVEEHFRFRCPKGAEPTKKIQDEKRTVGKTDFACKRVTLSYATKTEPVFRSQVDVWFSKEVKASTIVAYRIEREVRPSKEKGARFVEEATLTGYGSKDGTDWGAAAPAVDYDTTPHCPYLDVCLPFAPFEAAAAGDWASYSGSRAGTWTIDSVTGDKVVLTTPDGKHELAARKAPLVSVFFGLGVFKGSKQACRIEDVRQKVGAKEQTVKKVTFVSCDWMSDACQMRTLVFTLSPDVKGSGLVSARRVHVDAAAGTGFARKTYGYELTGYGTATGTTWGKPRAR